MPKTFSLWLLVAWVALVIIDMWFDVISTEVFLKISITIGLLMIVAAGLSVAKRGRVSENTDETKN